MKKKKVVRKSEKSVEKGTVVKSLTDLNASIVTLENNICELTKAIGPVLKPGLKAPNFLYPADPNVSISNRCFTALQIDMNRADVKRVSEFIQILNKQLALY